MNASISESSHCYGLYDGDNIIGFMSVLHQPHPVRTKLKRCSRLVILPDYQGIGLGYKFLTFIANLYSEKGYDFSIVTSARNMIYKLKNSDDWRMTRVSVNNCSSKKSAIDYKRASMRNNCKTASFFYKRTAE